MAIDFLFISNGYGEDAIAAKIASLLPEPGRAAAFPLVGEGKDYARRGIAVARAFPPPPSAGVSLSRDVKGGLIPLLRKEWRALRGLTGEVECAVAVGDAFPAFMARHALRKKFLFVGTAKSVNVQAYNFFERGLMRRSEAVFVRDAATAEALRRKGIAARYEGNPMMDEAAESRIPFPPFDGVTIALFPGSRGDAVQNFVIQVEALSALRRRAGGKIRGIAVLPPTIPLEAFAAKLSAWDSAVAAGGENFQCQYEQESVSLFLTSGFLGDALAASALVFGQAGTANEQAAGLGKPVIAFDFDLMRNGKLSWYRWRQKKLLGDSLQIVRVSSEAMADKAWEILESRQAYERLSACGKTRIGGAGASAAIAGVLSSLVPQRGSVI